MTNTTFSLSLKSVAAKGALALLAISSSLSAQTNPSTPPDGWISWGPPVAMQTNTPGYPDKFIGCLGGCISTSNQSLLTSLNLSIYKSVTTNDGHDYYLVYA